MANRGVVSQIFPSPEFGIQPSVYIVVHSFEERIYVLALVIVDTAMCHFARFSCCEKL